MYELFQIFLLTLLVHVYVMCTKNSCAQDMFPTIIASHTFFFQNSVTMEHYGGDSLCFIFTKHTGNCIAIIPVRTGDVNTVVLKN
jgi:hypothetical protein